MMKREKTKNKAIGTFQSQPIVQQELKRCRLRTVPFCASVLFFALAVLYSILFCYYGLTMRRVQDIQIRYDNECGNLTDCEINVTLENDLIAPIGFFYKLTNFNQLNRLIAESYSIQQLRGFHAKADDLEKCGTKIYIDSIVHDSNLLVPCGLLPSAVFNDTFSFLGFSGFSDQDITLSVDRNDLYKAANSEYENSSHWLRDSGLFPNGITDEHFIAWMRQSAFSPFRKLYSVSKENIPKGNYTISIQNNYPTSFFKGEKYFTLTEIRMIGTNKDGPAIIYGIMIAMFLIASAAHGLMGWKRAKPSSKFHPDNLENMFVDNT